MRLRMAVVTAFVGMAVGLGTADKKQAQSAAPANAVSVPAAEEEPAAVHIDGRTIIEINTAIGGYTAEERAARVQERLQAVAQGLSDAGGAIRWETVRRPVELQYPPLRDGYMQKLISSYTWLERELDVDSPIHLGHIAVATALGWLEFRELPTFRQGHPRLAAWFDRFNARPSMRATPMSGETHDH